MTYLEIRKEDFYKVESTVNGKQFVTARGWDDLSQMLRLYEKNGLTVDEKLVGQYLQNPRIAKEFAVYYDLFNKYRSDYQVDKILAGKATAAIKKRAKAAQFDERLSLLGLLLDAVEQSLRAVAETEDALHLLLESLRAVKADLAAPGADIQQLLDRELAASRPGWTAPAGQAACPRSGSGPASGSWRPSGRPNSSPPGRRGSPLPP